MTNSTRTIPLRNDDSVTIIAVSTAYDGKVLRIDFQFEGKAEWSEIGFNADNPQHVWRVSSRTTCFGGRAVSRINSMESWATRPEAHAAVVADLASRGVDVPADFLATADFPHNCWEGCSCK